MTAKIITTVGHNPVACVIGRKYNQTVIALSDATQALLPKLRVGDKVIVDDSWTEPNKLILLGKVEK